MTGVHFSFFNPDQIRLLEDKTLGLLADQGVRLDHHPEMFRLLKEAGAQVEEASGQVRFPREMIRRSLDQAPKEFVLGARGETRSLPLPRPDKTFYARSGTGAHGWIEPETGHYRKVTLDDLAGWARLVGRLEEISFCPFLFPSDAPPAAADLHALATLFKNTDKHLWVQPYSAQSVAYLIRMAAAVAGGQKALAANPLVSFIACSLSPRAFKLMDLEIILSSARSSLPIHACSLPGAAGTAPATMPGVIILAAMEILAMVAMAQAVAPGSPVVACPIIFSTDMRTGRSLQSSLEAMKGASGAIQFIKAAFGLPTHNYGTGSDSPLVDGQSMSERAMLTTLMALSGLDILGGAGQLEVATAVSPLQLLVDNEVLAMARQILTGHDLNQDHLALELIAETPPGNHFLTSRHTLAHCRDFFGPMNFTRSARESWEKQGRQELMDRVLDNYRALEALEEPAPLESGLAQEVDRIVKAAGQKLGG